MDSLKALTQKLKKETQEAAGPSKYVKRSQLEEARLQRIRDEEAREREEKDRKRKLQQGEDDGQPSKAARGDDPPLESPTVITKEEAIRRLRALRQPATLFGESDFDRMKRLKKAEQELSVVEEDEGVVAGKGNTLIDLQRQAQAKAKKDKAAENTKARPQQGDGEQAATEADQAAQEPEEDPTLAAFKRAAAALAERRAEEQMSIEDRIAKYMRSWCQEWEDDLERRPEAIRESGAGKQVTLTFKQTMKYLEPLYDRLKHNGVTGELLTGLWMMIQAMRDRNYLHANDIYLKLAIGNAPWPIGVTSVGIHERSAREKISHVMNTSGQAHIMNDEATRKYLQAIKRVITQLQRLYPTDPSRSVDFDTVVDPAKGASGAGCAKLALLEAEQKGENWKVLGLPAAPHFMDTDGSVRVPEKWQNTLARAARETSPGPREGSPAPEARPQRAVAHDK